jgi:hypothetical protein
MGKLVQVATNTVTSAVSSVTLTGIDTDDVYMVAFNNVNASADSEFYIRVTKSGTADTTANYDYADKVINAVGFSNRGVTNDTKTFLETTSTTANNETANGIIYLYNFNSSSEYSFYTYEQSNRNKSAQLSAPTGAGVHTVASASDGVQFTLNANNITSGTFTLYKVI